MEFVQHVDKDGKVLSRVAIPDAVVAASDHRDLVGAYASAGEAQRKQIHEAAIDATTPKKVAAESTAAESIEDE